MKRIILTLVLSFLSFGANAALVTANFNTTALTGPFAGSTATGTFTYDDSSITGSGQEIIDTTHGLTVEVTAFGQTFTDLDDIAKGGTWDELPELVFFNGIVTVLGFYVSETIIEEGTDIQPNVRAINAAGVTGFGDYSLSSTGVNTYGGSFQVVPIPAAVWLFGSGLGLLGWFRRKA